MRSKQLFGIYFMVKQPISKYTIMMGLIIIYLVIGYLAKAMEYAPRLPIYLLIPTIPVMIIGGGLEEIGWRYCLQPALEKKIPFFAASMITSAVWSIWHLPLFFIHGVDQYGKSFWVFAISCIGLSFVLGAIYKLTKSVWLCILAHALLNSSFTLLEPKIMNFANDWIPNAITSVCAAAVSCILVAIVNSNERRLKNI